MLKTFKRFIEDDEVEEMFVTGQAGTGKTTGLRELAEYCKSIGVSYTVCAFTHKACAILRSKLPTNAPVRTLHSYLKKRPTINQEALNHKHIERSVKMGPHDSVSILFVDEYSMVGEQDLMDLRDVEETVKLKIVWIGDANQLPPVGDAQAVKPWGPHQLTLTKVYRQANDNPLLDTLQQLVRFIEGEMPVPLEQHKNFTRGQDIVEWYDKDRMADDFDGVMLAYTNQQVEYLNAEATGRELPIPGDTVSSPTTKQQYTFEGWVEPFDVSYIMPPFGEMLAMGSKYKTLEYLLTKDYRFARLSDEDGEEAIVACVFGHYKFKQVNDSYKKAAASANAAIGKNPSEWAAVNRGSVKARERAKAWRDYLSFSSSVLCLDFAHAMTIHKSQGSTYKNVYLDAEDLSMVADIDYIMYLRLMYVALSRASQKVVTT